MILHASFIYLLLIESVLSCRTNKDKGKTFILANYVNVTVQGKVVKSCLKGSYCKDGIAPYIDEIIKIIRKLNVWSWVYFKVSFRDFLTVLFVFITFSWTTFKSQLANLIGFACLGETVPDELASKRKAVGQHKHRSIMMKRGAVLRFKLPGLLMYPVWLLCYEWPVNSKVNF